MFNRQRGKMSVWNQVGPRRGAGKQRLQDCAVTLGRDRHPDRRAVKPLLHLAPCGSDGFRLAKDPWIRDQAYKAQEGLPWQSNSRDTSKLLIQPTPRGRVLWHGGNPSINQKIGVDENHWKFSPSAMARTSATSSRFPTRQVPRSTESVWKGIVFGRGASICRKPCLRPSFMRAFCGCLRLFRTRSSKAATSSSRLRVVLTHQSVTLLMSRGQLVSIEASLAVH